MCTVLYWTPLLMLRVVEAKARPWAHHENTVKLYCVRFKPRIRPVSLAKSEGKTNF